jgi:hypothetical protein
VASSLSSGHGGAKAGAFTIASTYVVRKPPLLSLCTTASGVRYGRSLSLRRRSERRARKRHDDLVSANRNGRIARKLLARILNTASMKA